eukprot:scaffold1637_cov410-Prasinococcus_capsulatus_cf.AAC.28
MPCAIVGTHPLGLRCIASPGGATRRACRGVRAIFGTRRYPVMSAADFKRSSNNGNAQLASVYDGFRKCMLSLTAGAVVLTSSPTMLVAPEDAIAQAGVRNAVGRYMTRWSFHGVTRIVENECLCRPRSQAKSEPLMHPASSSKIKWSSTTSEIARSQGSACTLQTSSGA